MMVLVILVVAPLRSPSSEHLKPCLHDPVVQCQDALPKPRSSAGKPYEPKPNRSGSRGGRSHSSLHDRGCSKKKKCIGEEEVSQALPQDILTALGGTKDIVTNIRNAPNIAIVLIVVGTGLTASVAAAARDAMPSGSGNAPHPLGSLPRCPLHLLLGSRRLIKKEEDRLSSFVGGFYA